MRKNAWKKLNFIHLLCDHLLGKSHTLLHRIAVGVIVMGSGVLISKIFHDHHYMVYYVADTIGYLIHGIGATPIIEYFIILVRDNQLSEEQLHQAQEMQEEENGE